VIARLRQNMFRIQKRMTSTRPIQFQFSDSKNLSFLILLLPQNILSSALTFRYCTCVYVIS